MAVTIETTNRSQIRTAISAVYGSIDEYCRRNRISYTTLSNLLKGKGSMQNNIGIIERVNADTGADMKAWEK